MKKVKQVLALVGVILLVSLYIITVICAVTDNSGTMRMFTASIVATVVIPVLIWVYTFIYKLLKDHYGPDSRREDSHSSDTHNG